MHLVQILLPLAGGDGSSLPPARHAQVHAELVDRFGGLTAFTRSPARGLWDDGRQVEQDDVVVIEVMVDALDRAWWRDYRRTLETRFEQQELVIRASVVERL